MTNVAPSKTSGHKKLCTTCGEEIAAVARKCIKCDAYRDWRRYLAFSSTVLALMVALLSVATVAVPVFRDLLITKDSYLIGSFQGFSNNEAIFVVSNSGNRPGTVAEASLWVISPQGRVVTIDGLPLVPKYRDDSFFVDAGQSKVIKYQSHPQAKDIQKAWEDLDVADFQCAIGIDLINFSGRRDRPCFQSNCSRLLSAVFPNAKLREPSDRIVASKSNDRQQLNFLAGFCRPEYWTRKRVPPWPQRNRLCRGAQRSI
jgi:hypothetical protein